MTAQALRENHPSLGSGQFVKEGRAKSLPNAAGRVVSSSPDSVGAVRRAGRPVARVTASQIRLQRGLIQRGTGVFEQRLLLGAVNEAQVVDARIRLRRLAGADEVRDGDRGEEADDGHHDHDFNEREARLATGVDLHTDLLPFFRSRREADEVFDHVPILPSFHRGRVQPAFRKEQDEQDESVSLV